MNEKGKLSSTELGALWMTYQKKTTILRVLEHFIQTADDNKRKDLMMGLREKLHPQVNKIKEIFQTEGAAPPIGFTSTDVNLEAPKLFAGSFDIMFSRILKEISMGLYTLHLTMTYRKDIIELYRELTELTQTYYSHFTEYLIEEDVLPRPNHVTMPKSVDFVTDKSYKKGTNFFGDKRQLTTIEFGYLYHGLETNHIGMQLIEGFAQCANDGEVKKYFLKGKALSQEIIKESTEILKDNGIQPPDFPKGLVTNSVTAPFSDKLMMYSIYLLSNFSLGGQSFGAGFSFRNDLDLKFAFFAKDVFEYTREGVNLMIKKGWLEGPPQMDTIK